MLMLINTLEASFVHGLLAAFAPVPKDGLQGIRKREEDQSCNPRTDYRHQEKNSGHNLEKRNQEYSRALGIQVLKN